MRKPAVIEIKIAELRLIAHASHPTTYTRRAINRARDQIYALEWVLQKHQDQHLDWMANAIASLGAEARELFPATVDALEDEKGGSATS